MGKNGGVFKAENCLNYPHVLKVKRRKRRRKGMAQALFSLLMLFLARGLNSCAKVKNDYLNSRPEKKMLKRPVGRTLKVLPSLN